MNKFRGGYVINPKGFSEAHFAGNRLHEEQSNSFILCRYNELNGFLHPADGSSVQKGSFIVSTLSHCISTDTLRFYLS